MTRYELESTLHSVVRINSRFDASWTVNCITAPVKRHALQRHSIVRVKVSSSAAFDVVVVAVGAVAAVALLLLVWEVCVLVLFCADSGGILKMKKETIN